MSAVNNEVSVKVAVCAMAALALTVMGGWSFLASTSTVRELSNTTDSLGEVVISGTRQVAQNMPAVLVD